MKIVIQRKKLSDLVSLAAGATSAKPSLPALSHVLLTAVNGEFGGELSAHATNLERSITGAVAGDVKEEGQVLVHARRLASIAKELPAESVEVSVSKGGSQMVVASGGSVFRIATISTEEAVVPFGDLPFGPEGAASAKKVSGSVGTIMVSQAALRAALKAVAVAASTDETRFTLNGSYFHFGDGPITMIATDGRRLHRHFLTPDKVEGTPPNTIIPGDTVAHILQLLGDSGTVTADFHLRGIRFVFSGSPEASSFGSITLLSKVVEGQFPNYQQVIPKSHKHSSEFVRETFAVAVRRMALVCDEKSSSIHLGFEKAGMQLSAASPSLGEGRERIEGEPYEGPEFKMGMNPRYLADALLNVPQDKIKLTFNNDLEPLVVAAGNDFTAVLMPTRLS